MAAETGIEWADSTMNFWLGCQKVGLACQNCYAETWAERHKLDIWGPHGVRKRTAPGNWLQPDRWNAKVPNPAIPQLVFTNSLADFWDNQAPREWRVEAVDVMWRTPNLHWLILTKRPQNIVRLMPLRGLPPNVTLGISAADQDELDRDMPHVARAIQMIGLPDFFLSLEPCVGLMDVADAIRSGARWIIAGGESGPKARVPEPDYFRVIRDSCAVFGTPFMFKQWGEWAPAPKTMVDGVLRERNFYEAARFAGDRPYVLLGSGETMIRVGKKRAGRRLDGRTHTAFPAKFNRPRLEDAA